MLLRKPVLCADRAENTEIMATDHAKWADKSRKLRALFALFIAYWNDSCGMRPMIRRTCADQRVRRRKPHGKHSQRYIRRRRSARYLRQTCATLPKSGRYTSENNSLVCISYIITLPLSKISDIFVFRASCFSSLPGDKKLASIVKYPPQGSPVRFVVDLLSRAKLPFPCWDLLLCSAAACACRAIETLTSMDRIKQLKRHGERENGNVGQTQLNFTNIKS